MIKINNLTLPFDHLPDEIKKEAAIKLGISEDEILTLKIRRRSLDARAKRPLRRVYAVAVEIRDEASISNRVQRSKDLAIEEEKNYEVPHVNYKGNQERPVIVGTGPAGMFAGLILAEAGFNPILLERGKLARERVKDIDCFWKEGKLNPESNVQFGEGGAGTFSDGKLTTRVKDRHRRVEKILQEMVSAGAPPEILIDHKPHVGTANLVKVVGNLREKIKKLGGEYRFESRVDDLILNGTHVNGVVLASGEQITAAIVVLAIGHSARDTFTMLQARGLTIEPKPFSVGFRIEHAQLLIDQKQYGKHAGHPALGAADYQLSYRTSLGRTVYSFCMCPGGYVIGAASDFDTVVTNGMSQYNRDGKNANSAIVAEVTPADFPAGPLGGFKFQNLWEKKAFELGGGNYFAPAQLVKDFIQGKMTSQLGSVTPTYKPGVQLADLNRALPTDITAAIKEGLGVFNQRLPGFSGPDAIFTGVETRTSSPLRILRGKDGQCVSVKGIYPVGEGSGYAGGIMSSALDGIKAAEKIIHSRDEGGH